MFEMVASATPTTISDCSSPGAYFVTIVTHGRERILGNILNGQMLKSIFGEIAQKAWIDLPNHYSQISIGEFIVMPNHIHGILSINETSSDHRGGCITTDKNRMLRYGIS